MLRGKNCYIRIYMNLKTIAKRVKKKVGFACAPWPPVPTPLMSVHLVHQSAVDSKIVGIYPCKMKQRCNAFILIESEQETVVLFFAISTRLYLHG